MTASLNDSHARGFARDLRARNRSPRTIDSYLAAMRNLRDWADDQDLTTLTPAQLRDFFGHLVATLSPTTAAIRYRSLQQFYKWATNEELVEKNPMAGMRPPAVPEQPVDVLTIEQVKALLRSCEGRGFEQRRDQAMLRLFLEPGGLRLSEMVGLAVDDVDFDLDVVVVLGKGRRERAVPFGAKTGTALERYVRDRRKHPSGGRPELWLGSKGPLTPSGVQQMLRRRAAVSGIPHLYPHMLRHTAAHEWLAAGGHETDAMRLFGWRSRSMLERYGASAAVQRAHQSARGLSLGDRY